MIHIRDLTVKFNQISVLENISVDVNRGEIVHILGPNGSGKNDTNKDFVGPYSSNKW